MELWVHNKPLKGCRNCDFVVVNKVIDVDLVTDCCAFDGLDEDNDRIRMEYLRNPDGIPFSSKNRKSCRSTLT